MPRFAMVQRETWTDEWFAPLNTDARLLWLWAICGPEANISGLYPASYGAMKRALALVTQDNKAALEQRVERALEQLQEKPLLLYDEVREVVWVCNRAHYANQSPKTRGAMVREFGACPQSPLKDEFKKRYGRMLRLDGRRTQ